MHGQDSMRADGAQGTRSASITSSGRRRGHADPRLALVPGHQDLERGGSLGAVPLPNAFSQDRSVQCLSVSLLLRRACLSVRSFSPFCRSAASSPSMAPDVPCLSFCRFDTHIYGQMC